MTDLVFVHVGPYKSGTTYLQQVLRANKTTLADHGVLFPGRRYRDQARAVADVLDRPWQGSRSRAQGAWDALVEEVVTFPGERAVLSHESLSTAEPGAVTRIVQSLGSCEVHLVYTARDLSKVLPSMWQTHMRNGQPDTWSQFLASVRGDEDADPVLGRRFWRAQDVRDVLQRWEPQIPRDRLHVVTVPRAGADQDLLWQRFSSVLGIEHVDCSLEVQRSNTSVGPAEAEVLRQVNAKVADRLDIRTYEHWVKVVAAHRLEGREGVRFALPAEELGWLLGRVETITAFIAAGGYDVRGDLAELVPQEPSGPVVRPDDVDLVQAVDAATDVVTAMLLDLDRRQTGPGAPVGAGRARAQQRDEVPAPTGQPAPKPASRGRRGGIRGRLRPRRPRGEPSD